MSNSLVTSAALWIGLAAVTVTTRAQLAITEVMAGPNMGWPDFWELTNFGAEALQLDGYSIEDKSGKSSRRSSLNPFPFDGMTLQPGESAIFFRRRPDDREVTNASDFRFWWGESRLPSGLQIREYETPGLSGDVGGDALLLRDSANRIVDHIVFDESLPGRSLVYDPTTGTCCDFSVPNVNQAFRASLSTDVGSPGYTSGPISLSIAQEPEDQLVDAGMDVTLSVTASGLPRPRYRWFINGVEKIGETSSTLLLSNVSPTDAGSYQVMIENGAQERSSRVAKIQVNTKPACASLMNPPVDTTVFPDQTATFTVRARGYPPPQYQWQAHGIDLPGETNRTLTLPHVDSSFSGTTYRVQVCNTVSGEDCCVYGDASLTVMRRPRISFTEVMAAPSHEGLGTHQNWFELTNSDSVPVNLAGYRFADSDTALSLGTAFVIEGPLILQPGESAVFVENLTPAAFRRWWGSQSLEPNLQIMTYHGFGLSESGEVLYLWNPTPTVSGDTVATVSWAAQLSGVSTEFEDINCDDAFGCSSQINRASVLGQYGAFRAAEADDLGSPGYIANPPPRLLSLEPDTVGLRLRWRAIEGKTYQLKAKNALTDPAWVTVVTQMASSAVLTIWDKPGSGGSARFYRLDVMP